MRIHYGRSQAPGVHDASLGRPRRGSKSQGYNPLTPQEEGETSPSERSTALNLDDSRNDPRVGRVSEEDNPKVAASKAIAILTKMENQGFCGIESESIYGAAVAMPQIARSCGWPPTLTSMVIRIYFFTLINLLLQGFLLSMIGTEQLVMYPFAGQMHLCDFGASIKDCPGAPNCRGPLGTEYTAARLYDYDTWSTRVFIKQSLQAIFPDKADTIEREVDPGEYGMESFYCRMSCVFIFMLAVVDDLAGTILLARTLFLVPSEAQTWISYEVPEWADKDDVKSIKELSELDLVKFKVAGIPRHWKAINFLVVLLPKLALWFALVKSGVHYLMETAGIVNVIVNAMALTFVLEVDEMVFQRFSTILTKHIMSNIEDLPNFTAESEEEETEQEALDRFNKTELAPDSWKKYILIIPRRLIFVLVLQAVFLFDYYKENCMLLDDGSWVSKPLSLPEDLVYRPLRLMFGIVGPKMPTPIWEMPNIR